MPEKHLLAFLLFPACITLNYCFRTDLLIDLSVDICKRYGIKKLTKGENLTWHSMFAKTECPGPYLLSKMDWVAIEVNKRLED